MESLRDPDLNVRRATLAFFNSAVHNKPSLVRDLLGDILPLLYQETKVRRDLIREVSPHGGALRHLEHPQPEIGNAPQSRMFWGLIGHPIWKIQSDPKRHVRVKTHNTRQIKSPVLQATV